MKKEMDYKVPDGKLLRVEADIDGGVINSIKITGDFFIHPETALEKMEDLLKGKKISEAERSLGQFIEDNCVRIIGFTVSDISDVLEKMSR